MCIRDRFTVASIFGKYDKDRQLGDNLVMNAAKFDSEELTLSLIHILTLPTSDLV